MSVNTFEDEALAMREIEKILVHMQLAGLSDKKAGTHGGERTSPCPICKMKDGYGGTKRCQWWPARPYFGRGSKDDPMFWCRDCGESGDLVKMYCRVHKVSFGEACAYFGIKEYTHRESGRVITLDDPKINSQKKPEEIWLARAWKLVDDGVELLFSEAGEEALMYLMVERGLTEETIRYLKLGYQPDNRRWDAPELWGLEGKKLRIHKGIIMPELHVNPQTGEVEVYSIEIRRSEMDMFDEELETGREQYKYDFIRGGSRGLFCIGVKRGLPASMNEGKFDAYTAWQEGRDEFGGIATQSKDGALDNVATVMTALNKPSVILLTHEADEGGCKAAETWDDYLDNAIIHHPPNRVDLNKYHVSGGSVYDFLSRGLERYEQRKSRYDAIFGPFGDKAASLLGKVEQELATAITGPKNDIPESEQEQVSWEVYQSVESNYSDANAALAAEAPVESRQDEAETPLVEEAEQLHQEDIEEPSTVTTEPNLGACLRCGEPGKYVDPDGNVWCGQDIASYRLMRDGSDPHIMFSNLYLGDATSVRLRLFGVDGTVMLQDLPCERDEIRTGRGSWLKFAKEASVGDVWKAATEVHQVLSGFTPRIKPYVRKEDIIQVSCARVGCRHDAGKPWRYNDDKKRDEEGKETKVFKWSLYWPHKVELGFNMLGEEEAYTFCPRCVTAAYLLELARAVNWPARGKVVGREAWIKYCLEASLFQIADAFDLLRREYPNVWRRVQSDIPG